MLTAAPDKEIEPPAITLDDEDDTDREDEADSTDPVEICTDPPTPLVATPTSSKIEPALVDCIDIEPERPWALGPPDTDTDPPRPPIDDPPIMLNKPPATAP